MRRFVAVDPASKNVGVAVFEDGHCIKVAHISLAGRPEKRLLELRERLRDEIPVWWEGVTLAVEGQQIYTKGKQSDADPANILLVAQSAGVVIGALNWGDVKIYLPREWKGQLPKTVSNKRSYDALSKSMRRAVDDIPKSFRNDVLDAVGIGLYHLTQSR